MYEDLPAQYRLSFLLGEIVRNDSYAEHEARVLWNRLDAAGLNMACEAREGTFGRLLPQMLRMVAREGVPEQFRRPASQTFNAALRAHRFRARLVHDLLIEGPWTRGHVWSALNANEPQPLTTVEDCVRELTRAIHRLRGLYVVAPHWVGGPVVDPGDAMSLQGWMRVAMGHLEDVPGEIRGTPGKAPAPPDGWRETGAR